ERVEITVDGVSVANAEYGREAPHVAPFWKISTDPAHPRVGYRAMVELPPGTTGTHWLGLRLQGRDGSVEPWQEQRIDVVEWLSGARPAPGARGRGNRAAAPTGGLRRSRPRAPGRAGRCRSRGTPVPRRGRAAGRRGTRAATGAALPRRAGARARPWPARPTTAP